MRLNLERLWRYYVSPKRSLHGSDEMASNIAKKGDSRDVVSYVFKETKDEKVRILSLLRPLKHPESIRPLLSVLNVSRVGLWKSNK